MDSERKVLVLNATFVPISICSWKRAVKLVYKRKASVVEEGRAKIHSQFILPLIVKLINYVSLPFNGMVLSRKNVYLRDNHRCQYCGKNGNLTLDHIMPRSRGGNDRWENMVACCIRCNNLKGDRTLEEAGMRLLGVPYKPPSMLYLHMTRLPRVPDCWRDYFFDSRN